MLGAVTVAYLILLIAFVDNFAMLPTVAPYAEEHGAQLTGVGVAVGAYSLTNLVFNVVGGVLIDCVGRRRLVVGSLLLVSVSMLAYPAVDSLGSLIAVRLLHGVGGGILVPAVFTVLGDRAPVTGRGRAMGRAGAMIGIAAVIAPAAAGGIRQAAGFSAVFWTVAAISAAGALLAWLWLEEPRPALQPLGGPRFTVLLGRRELQLACGTAFAFTAAVGSLAAFLPVHVVRLGHAPAATGGLFTLFAVVAVVVMLSRAAGLGERRGAARPISLGLTVYVVALLVLWATPPLGLTALAAAVFGVGYGVVFPAMAGAVSSAAAPEERGRAYGLFLACFSLGFVVVPPLGGAIGDAWPSIGPFGAAVAICAAGAIGARALRRHHAVDATPSLR